MSSKEATQLCELRSDNKLLVTRGSVPLQELPVSPLRQVAPFLSVHQLSTLSASSPCASSTSGEYRKTIMKEIRAGIDREHWRRLAEVAVVAAEIGTRNEGHTTGVNAAGVV